MKAYLVNKRPSTGWISEEMPKVTCLLHEFGSQFLPSLGPDWRRRLSFLGKN